ncbi:MAG: hypothetical protein ABFE07_29420 [Armatimonadia bacterium]
MGSQGAELAPPEVRLLRIIKGPGGGLWQIEEKAEARLAFNAALNSFTKEELQEVRTCPLCGKKTATRIQHYRPTRDMVEIMFEMVRIMNRDPQGRGYVRMMEHPEHLKDEDRILGTASGTKQNHKMTKLGLISYVGHDGKPYDGSSKRILGAYCLTQKGLDLLNGRTISPWDVHLKNGVVVMLAEDEHTSGNINDVKNLSYDEWKQMARETGVEHLLIPKR